MPVGAIAGAAVGLGQTVYGAIKAGQERKKMEDYLNKQEAENESFYNQNFYQDYTQRADTQALIKNLRDNLKRKSDADANTAAVTGATAESQLAKKELDNKVVSDTYSNVAAQGANYKDRITDRYLNRKNYLGASKMGSMEGNAQGYENLVGSGLNTIGSAANSLASTVDGKKQAKAPEKTITEQFIDKSTQVEEIPNLV